MGGGPRGGERGGEGGEGKENKVGVCVGEGLEAGGERLEAVVGGGWEHLLGCGPATSTAAAAPFSPCAGRRAGAHGRPARGQPGAGHHEPAHPGRAHAAPGERWAVVVVVGRGAGDCRPRACWLCVSCSAASLLTPPPSPPSLRPLSTHHCPPGLRRRRARLPPRGAPLLRARAGAGHGALPQDQQARSAWRQGQGGAALACCLPGSHSAAAPLTSLILQRGRGRDRGLVPARLLLQDVREGTGRAACWPAAVSLCAPADAPTPPSPSPSQPTTTGACGA